MSGIRVALSVIGVAYAVLGLMVIVILGGWIGALMLGWLAWEFWTHSSIPKVAA